MSQNHSETFFSQRVKEIPKSAIHEMTRLSKEIDDVAFLSWAKPTSATPEHIREAAIKAIREGKVGGYTETSGLPALREAICKKLARDNGIEAQPEEIIVTIGAVEGLSAAILATVDPGDEVILPTPTYSTHVDQVRLAGGRPVFAETKEEEGFALDVEAMRRAVTPRTRAILFCTPSNPTGTVFDESQLREVAKLAVKHDLKVITDEAYEYFTFDNASHFSIGALPEMKKRAISCFTITKTYAMTGWRIGYLHADIELIRQIRKAHIPLAICAPVVSQYAALAALEGPQDCVEGFRKKYESARNLMCRRLDVLSDHLAYQKPQGSYLMFPRVLDECSSDSVSFCKKLLREARVSTTPGIAFGPSGENHIRLSFCVSDEMIEKAFDRLERFFMN